LPAFCLFAVAACGRPVEQGPIVVSAIGNIGELPAPVRAPIDAATAVVLSSLAEGLVRFDAQGQIEAGLAQRWDVSDDGLYYTFRLIDGSPIDADAVARQLRRALDRRSDNPLKPLLAGIDEIVAVTPEVVEIRLGAPRADLLQLLAAPELTLASRDAGGGPFRLASRDGPRWRLESPPPGDTEGGEAVPQLAITLHADWASKAVARFAAGRTALVSGGSFADLPLVAAAHIDPRQVRFDPVHGLFGLRIVNADGWLARPANRLRLAGAIDRARIVRLIAPANAAPGPAAPPAAPPSSTADGTAPPILLRIAMPPGAGARLMFRLVQADWRRIGIDAEAVSPDDPDADLRLLDEVAPTDADDWAIARFGCASARRAPCSAEADAALADARSAPSPVARTAAIERARTALAASGLFIDITQPIRWSLVAPDLTGWTENGRAAHPLDQLRR
jgi:peptide/nickel transport system substrate-binding protein